MSQSGHPPADAAPEAPSPEAAHAEASAERSGERYIAVARVTRPHGVRGEVRVVMFNPDSDVLTGKPRTILRSPDGQQSDKKLQGLRPGPHYLIARISGVSHRDAAQALRGYTVEVKRSALDEVAEDEFYFCDLEGCRVELPGDEFGIVKRVMEYPTCDALVVERDGKKPVEVPLHANYIESIDIAAGRIVVTSLEGLS